MKSHNFKKGVKQYIKPPKKEYKPYTDDEYYEEVKDDEAVQDIFSDECFLTKEQIAEYSRKESEKLETELENEYGNSFPIKVFPKVIQDYIADAERTNNYPVDFFASSILVAISAAMRNIFRIKFKEGFQQTAALMLVLVGRPGSNKSYPLSKALEPIYEMEKLEFKRYIQVQRTTQKKGENAENDNVSKIRRRYVISDATLESACDLLAENPAGLLLHNDEFSGFLDNMNRYRKGDDLQKWMSIWSGITFPIDRVSKEPQLIINPFVSMVGTIQPSVLSKFKEDFRGSNGFIDRVLFAYPSKIDSKPWSMVDIDENLSIRYKSIINAILKTPEVHDDDGAIKPYVLKYSVSALDRLLQWQAYNTELINDYAEEHLISMYKKLELYIHRLTLIMCVVDYASKNDTLITSGKIGNLPVLRKHVVRAIHLVEYYRECALKVHSKLPTLNPVDALSSDAKRWYEALQTSFTTKEALQLATKLSISKRMAQYYLADDALFRKSKRGEYDKKYYVVTKH